MKKGETKMVDGRAAEVIAQHRVFIRNTVRHFGVRSADVDDVTQEVFQAVNGSLARLEIRKSDSLGKWLQEICHRQAMNHFRGSWRWRRAAPLEDVKELVDTSPGAEEKMLDEERTALVRTLLDSIKPTLSMVVRAYYIEERSMAEVARRCGILENSAWNRLRRGLQALREVSSRVRATQAHALCAARARARRER
ncbi:MAG: sigma-70 family RNA polymerase sigma factor [Polyangiaceae bacterium]